MSADLGDLFLKLYDKYGVIGIVGALITLLAFLGIYEIMKYVVSSYLEKKTVHIPFFRKKLYRDAGPLDQHTFFQSLDRMINYEVSQMNIKCTLRRKIFTKLIKIRLSVVKEVFMEITKIPPDAVESKDLVAMMQTAMVKIKYEWRKQAEDAGIPQIVLDKFNEEMEVYFQIQDLLMTEDAGNDMLPSNMHRLQYCFRTAEGIERRIFTELKNVITRINGELSKLEFEGARCTNCDEECKNSLQYQHSHPHGTDTKTFKRIDPQ